MAGGFLKDVGMTLIAASGMGFTAYRMKLPLLLGYLAAGILLGSNMGLGLITNVETITTISEIGLVLLMYILGMEIDIKKLIRAGKAVILNGIIQFLGCVLLSIPFFYYLAPELVKGHGLIYFAVASGLSSTLIVVKLLSDSLELDTLTSRITLGILVFQDLWAIAFLAAQPNLSDFSLVLLLLSLLKALLLIAITFVLAKFILPHIFRMVGKQMELTLVVALGWCFMICFFAKFLSLSMEMGALLAGVSVAAFPYHTQIAVKVSGLRDFFITLFFVALGLQIPFPNKETFYLASIIVLFVLFSRILTIFPVLYFLKYGNRSSLIPALNLGQVSEFSLVILTLGVSYKHIPQEILSGFIIALVVTTLFSSLLIPRSYSIYRLINPWLIKLKFKEIESDLDYQSKKNSNPSSDSFNKIVFLGFHKNASSLYQKMMLEGDENLKKIIKVVDYNPETIRKLKSEGIQVFYGDIGNNDILHHLDLHDAQIIISTLPDSFLKGTTNLKILNTIKDIAPNASIILTAENLVSAQEMYKQGAAYVFLPRLISAHYLNEIILRIRGGDLEKIKEKSINYLSQLKEIID